MKTHKERVEELNKYLSNLSEHHDMYVASPPSLQCTSDLYGWPLRMSCCFGTQLVEGRNYREVVIALTKFHY